MKKIGVVILILFLFFPLITAQNGSINAKAEDCIKDRITDEKCSGFSLEEQIFSLLTIGECKDEILDDSKNGECFPEKDCSTKLTAQAVLALNKDGFSTSKPEAWLLKQAKSTSELSWYLQIDSSKKTNCEISYEGSDYSVTLRENKQLDSNAGSCLRLENAGYWLRVSTTCYGTEFKISCDESFSTSLLYEKISSSEVFVSGGTKSSSAGGEIKQEVESLCFAESGSCNYETTLWTAFVLDSLGKNIDAFLPYLVTLADDKQGYFPESFLDTMTTSETFHKDVITSQDSEGFWDKSGDKFYDTAVALLSLEGLEKTSVLAWLEDVQGSDGCWQNNLRNTAFILYAGWLKQTSTTSTGPTESCADLNGEVCSSSEECDEFEIDSTDGDCCLGLCKEKSAPSEKSECEKKNGRCRSACLSDEEEKNYDCDSGDVCCLKKESGGSYWFVWLLVILIILVVIGIIFRNKLGYYWFRLISKFKSKPGPSPGDSGSPGPPTFPQPQMSRTTPRRILPPSQHQRPAPRKPQKDDKEFADVLKKLKDMSS